MMSRSMRNRCRSHRAHRISANQLARTLLPPSEPSRNNRHLPSQYLRSNNLHLRLGSQLLSLSSQLLSLRQFRRRSLRGLKALANLVNHHNLLSPLRVRTRLPRGSGRTMAMVSRRVMDSATVASTRDWATGSSEVIVATRVTRATPETPATHKRPMARTTSTTIVKFQPMIPPSPSRIL